MFSIIILTCDKAPYTEKCLTSILQAEDVPYEVVVVDNGSTDDTPRVLDDLRERFAADGHELRAFFNEENVGACRGRNQAMREADGDFFVFLDNDTVICTHDWLTRMQGVLDTQEGARIVGPKMTYPFEPHDVQCAGVGISRTGRVQFRGRGDPRDDPRLNERRDVQCLISACFMSPRALYDEIGELDEAYSPIQFEDFDFCYRARQSGYRVLYTPAVEVHHWESITSNETPTLPNREVMLKNWLRFKRQWRHMYSQEDGPSDEECKWKTIRMPSLEGVRER